MIVAALAALGTFLGTLAVKMVEWFGKYMARKMAVLASFGVIVLGMFVTCESAIFTLMSTVSYVAPPELQTAFNTFMPSNMDECISIIITAKIARYAYDWYLYFAELDVQCSMI